MAKLNVGIDVSKDSLDVAYWDYEQNEAVFMGKFSNDKKGFNTIAQKIKSKCEETNATSVCIIMEPTGGYEQRFATVGSSSSQPIPGETVGKSYGNKSKD